jgi:7-cyano-7-deazaguanine synthase
MSRTSLEPVALLLSGGLDSAILLGQLLSQGRPVHPLYIQSGLHWQAAELLAVQKYLAALAAPRLQPLTVLELPLSDVYGDHWSVQGRGVPDEQTPDEAVYLPGRNLLLAVKPAIWCRLHGVEALALGVLGSNPFSDASDEFFRLVCATVKQAVGGRFEVLRPFAHLHKVDVMRLGAELPLELTFSCIDPHGSLHCGHCNKCAERKTAFAEAGLPDRTAYATASAPSSNGQPQRPHLSQPHKPR